MDEAKTPVSVDEVENEREEVSADPLFRVQTWKNAPIHAIRRIAVFTARCKKRNNAECNDTPVPVDASLSLKAVSPSLLDRDFLDAANTSGDAEHKQEPPPVVKPPPRGIFSNADSREAAADSLICNHCGVGARPPPPLPRGDTSTGKRAKKAVPRRVAVQWRSCPVEPVEPVESTSSESSPPQCVGVAACDACWKRHGSAVAHVASGVHGLAEGASNAYGWEPRASMVPAEVTRTGTVVIKSGAWGTPTFFPWHVEHGSPVWAPWVCERCDAPAVAPLLRLPTSVMHPPASIGGASSSGGIGVGSTVRVGLCVAHHPWPRLF